MFAFCFVILLFGCCLWVLLFVVKFGDSCGCGFERLLRCGVNATWLFVCWIRFVWCWFLVVMLNGICLFLSVFCLLIVLLLTVGVTLGGFACWVWWCLWYLFVLLFANLWIVVVGVVIFCRWFDLCDCVVLIYVVCWCVCALVVSCLNELGCCSYVIRFVGCLC